MATPPRRRRRRSQADRDRLIEEAVKIENERMAGMKIRLNDDPWQPLRLALRDIDDYGPDSAPMDARATARERLIEAIRAAPGIPDDCRHELAELLVRAKLVKRAEGRPKEPATAFRMVWLARAVDWLAEVNDRHQLRPAVMRKVARVESAGKECKSLTSPRLSQGGVLFQEYIVARQEYKHEGSTFHAATVLRRSAPITIPQ
jgi:hypothetical protein